MRIISILLAGIVALSLYALVFNRDAVMRLAGAEPARAVPAEDDVGASDVDTPPAEDAAPTAVSVVALRSEARTIDGAVLLRGRTEAERQVEVSAETTGRIVSPPLRKGAFIEAGDLLCQLDPGTSEVRLAEAEARLTDARAQVPAAQARVAEAEALLREAEINGNAASKLSEGGFASQTRVAGAEAAVEAALAAVESARSGVDSARSGVQAAEAGIASAEKEIERLEIRAPFSGLLESDTAELGSLMQPGGMCATVIQLDPIKLVGFVPEANVSKIEVGAPARARLASGATVQGRVTFLSRSSDAETRTFRTEIEVANPDLAIRDGQTVEIVIASDGTEAHLLPQSAMTLDDDGRLGVRLVGADDGLAHFAPIDLLRDTTDGVWVAGLEAEVAVIVVGQEFVTDGVPVTATYREAAVAPVSDETAAAAAEATQ